MLTFQQVINIREVLLCSTLSERPVKMEFTQNPGPHLQVLLKLLQLIQTGCKIEVTPKAVTYIPGIITSQDGLLQHYNCGSDRSISYFLEPLIILSLYAKADLNIELQGMTADPLDMSVDTLISGYLPLLKRFAPNWDGSIKILRRGPDGLILFHSKPIKQLCSVDLVDRGPFKRIRGVCYGTKVAPNLLNRVVSQCRNVFNDYIPDVWITTDLQKQKKGHEDVSTYGVSLCAETINGAFVTTDAEYQKGTPEELGELAALRLLDEIKFSGFVDTSLQQYCLLMQALSQKKLTQVKLGRISTQTVETLRIIKQFLGVTFNIEDGVFSCLGCGLINISRNVN